MKYTQRGQQCDEDIMQAGIAAIDWQVGHICVSSHVSPRLIEAVEMAGQPHGSLSPVDGDERAW